MQTIPESEKDRFEALLKSCAERAGLNPADYLRKVWYHEQAARLGEYVALVLTDELTSLLP